MDFKNYLKDGKKMVSSSASRVPFVKPISNELPFQPVSYAAVPFFDTHVVPDFHMVL
jgi:hypothetical protein